MSAEKHIPRGEFSCEKPVMSDGENRVIPVAGKVYGSREIEAAIEAVREFHLTAGRFNRDFQSKLAEYVGVDYALAVNSGSSANLLAVSALMSPALGDRALRPGDEVITVAAGFPTTIAPILQNGLIPVFVDICLPHYNVDVQKLREAVSSDTKAIILAHALGNPFDVEQVLQIAEAHGLWLIEDCCDALGSLYPRVDNLPPWQATRQARGCSDAGPVPVGSFGHISTFSFYPAHHITTGEGGAVATSCPELYRIIRSLRDWGRDCRCETGESDSCGSRFSRDRHISAGPEGELPAGYDHKYVYSHLGYNLRMTEIQAAIGIVQLDRLEEFGIRRRRNFEAMSRALKHAGEWLILPQATSGSDPSWFGFPITIRDGGDLSRRKLSAWLWKNNVDTRPLFSGNILRQPCMKGRKYRIAGSLECTDMVLNNSFWTGVFPALNPSDMRFVADMIQRCPGNRANRNKSGKTG